MFGKLPGFGLFGKLGMNNINNKPKQQSLDGVDLLSILKGIKV
jgi:hypothetical protein